MATPASVNVRAQWGPENSAGDAVPADRSFRATTVTVGPSFEVGNVRPAGVRFRTVNYVKKEWTEGTMEGVPCFRELPSFLTWSLGAPEDVDNGDGTVTHNWRASTGGTRTLQLIGDANTAQVTGCFVKGFEMGWGRNSGDSTIKADIVGGKWDDDAQATPDPLIEQVVPVVAHEVSIYVSNRRADLGTVQLPDAIKVDFKTGDMRGPVWTLDASKPSLSDIVPLAMDSASVELLVKATAEGRAFLEQLRSTGTMYLRIEAVGPAPFRLVMDFAVQATDHKRDDQDGVWAATVPLAIVEDQEGFSHAIQLTDDNL